MRIVQRLVVLGGVLLLVAAPALPSALAQEEPAPDFGGWVLRGSASGTTMIYDQPSLGVPVSPTFELSADRSTATNEAGSGYGLSSILWPGAIADVGPVLSGELRNMGLEAFPDLPLYPVRAETRYPQGPTEASQGVDQTGIQGVAQKSSAGATSSNARTVYGGLGLEGVFSTGGIVSHATSELTDDGFAESNAVAEVTGIDFFGILKIESVRTAVRAFTDGVKGKVEGGLVVTGATIAGQAVTIDKDGIHAADQGGGAGADVATKAAQALLKGLGIELYVAEPIDVVEGPAASRSVGGLVIVMHADKIKPVIDLLPPPLQDQFGTLPVQFDGIFTTVIGAANVSAAAAPVFVAPPLPPVDTSGGDTAPLPEVPIETSPLPTVEPSPVAAAGPPAALPVGLAISGALAALAAGIGVLGTTGLRKLATATSVVPEERCELEE